MRYSSFLSERFKSDLYSAGWGEFLAYRSYLTETGISRATIRCYLSYIASYYRLLAQATQVESLSNLCNRIRTVGLPRRTWSQRHKPFNSAALDRVLRVARRAGGEDYVFVMTLLYTGGRAQFYGLRVSELDFDRAEISTEVKPGKRVTIPLHPALATLLKKHLAERDYESTYLFRRGRDPTTRTGMRANRQNAWRTCKRIEDRARVGEPVYPHRFRKTLATIGRREGMDAQFIQAILGHETVLATLDHYAQVDLEEVKREFAKLNLLAPRSTSAPRSFQLLGELVALAPKDREHEWKMHIEALLALSDNSVTEASKAQPRYVRFPRKAHSTAKKGLGKAFKLVSYD